MIDRELIKTWMQENVEGYRDETEDDDECLEYMVGDAMAEFKGIDKEILEDIANEVMEEDND